MTPAPTKTVVMMVWNTCETDSRVIKEATTLASAGYRVTVVCLAAPHLPEVETRDGVTYRRVKEAFGPLQARVARPMKRVLSRVRSRERPTSTAAPRGPVTSRLLTGAYRVLTFRLASLTMAKTVRSLAPSVIHAHDLQTLPAAARLAKRLGVSLVYDSHELASDVSIRPPEALRRLIVRAERKHIADADRVITVSRGIVEHLQREYGIALPVIVYNAPPTIAHATTGRTVRGDLGLGEAVGLAVYVGGLAAYRGLEETIDAVGMLPEFHLACVGPRRVEWEDAMHARARLIGADERLHFLDPVPIDELLGYLETADVGVIAIQDVCLSYRYTMPNKLFETVLAGVPVVVSDLPHLREFVEQQGVGRVADGTDSAALAKAIAEVTSSADFRPSGGRLQKLRREFGWEAQGERLLGLYADLLSD